MAIRRFPSNTSLRTYDRIWLNYARAITRRGREATDQQFLTGKWAQVSPFFIRHRQSYLLGVMVGGLFIPTHFSPSSLRSGYELIEKCKAEKVIFAVTPDLVQDLTRMGFWKVPGFVMKIADWLGFSTRKSIAVSPAVSWLDLHQLLTCGDYWNKRDQSPAPVVKNLRRRVYVLRQVPSRLIKVRWERSRPTLADVWPK